MRELEKPTPTKDEVLVLVEAASVNRADLDAIVPRWAFLRLFMGLRRPRVKRVGIDVAGVVEAVGEEANRFKVGDRVFGDLFSYGSGAFAEYVSVHRTTDYTRPAEPYDWILDVDAHLPLRRWRRALKPRGVYVAQGGSFGLRRRSHRHPRFAA